MPVIKPFKAVRYNIAKVKGVSSVISPPYDIISPKLQDELYSASPYNFVRLDFNKMEPSDIMGHNDRYTRSRDLFKAWLDENILARDPRDSIYIYSQKYKNGSKTIEQVGFIGLMGLNSVGKEKVLPHENTLTAPKEDRLSLMRATEANLSPIFVLYEDKTHRLTNILKKFMTGNACLVDIKFDNVRHRLWSIEDGSIIKKIASSMAHKNIFIADGHHRYEVARMYCNETKGSADKVMVYFVEMDERMLTVLPAHRVVLDIGILEPEEILGKLSKFFRVEKVSGLKALMTHLSKSRPKLHSFGMYLGEKKFYVLRLKNEKDSDKAIKDKPLVWRRLDVAILHRFIMQEILDIRDEDNNISYIKDSKDAIGAVDSGKFKIAFILNPTKVSEVKRIANIGERMPKKSTYFYPKQLSGLVINKFQ